MDSMPIAKSIQYCEGSPRLVSAYNAGLLVADVPEDRHEQAARCAMYLDRSGWMEAITNCGDDPGGLVTTEEAKQIRTAAAIEQLQAVSLLPSGLFGWVLSFALRWMFTAFIESLITDWMEE
tara:strand:- start:98 stop:463 length:366 start_codon:yes stop_codon:yes gene_type:complete